MLFEHRYAGSSGVTQGDAATAMSFAPDTLRKPTYFKGTVTRQVEFREAISALHDVVTSDLRFIPKDRSDYLAWREKQSYIDLAQVTRDQKRISDEIVTLQTELSTLEARSAERKSGFYGARRKYFDYLYNRDKELWFKLDPVITVHPDQVFFECFSKDESSYGRLAASYNIFEELGERANGTTNIDYSEKLYAEFQKIRSYKTTSLEVDPGGFNVQTTMEDQYREVKMDLPDSWVRGFLQVSSAATLPAHVVELHPMDVHNLCHVLRRNKELFGPRSLRFKLTPGAPVEVVVDPWGWKVPCPRSRYVDSRPGSDTTEIRIWGRRRLFILERLLPRAKRVRLFLLGTGLPTFWVVDLGDLSFTLGLSGWTNNNWSDAGNFDLMAAREEVDSVTQQRVYDELGATWLATPEELAARTGLATPIVASALAGWVQAGRAIFDLDAGVYRKRELTRDPLPVEKLRFTNEREQSAARLLQHARIAIDKADTAEGGLVLAGRIRIGGVASHASERLRKHGPNTYAPTMTFDVEQRLVAGECTCDYYVHNKLHRGPCEHMLALRAAHRRGKNDVIELDTASNASQWTKKDVAQEKVNFQDEFRAGVRRAAELRAAGRTADSIAVLERVARLAPPDSDEQGRLQEVIAEARYEAGEHRQAIEHADRALRRFANAPLALRIKRDALVRLDDVPAAIIVARMLAGSENTVIRWRELVALCEQIGDWTAVLQFANEGLHLHRNESNLLRARDAAKARPRVDGEGSTATTPEVPADEGGDGEQPAPKASWWRRAVDKITGRAKSPSTPPPTDATPAVDTPLARADEQRLEAIADELESKGLLRDRRAAMQLMRPAYTSATSTEVRAHAIADALHGSTAVKNVDSQRELLALLRRTLS